MKPATFLSSFAIFIAFAIFAGCTKDYLPAPKGDNFVKSNNSSNIDRPINNFGSIKGILSPIPSIVSIKIYNEAGYSVLNKINVDGSFLVENLSPGYYNMSISYVVRNPENTYTNSLDVSMIEVQGGGVTSLGVVILPWTY